MILQGKAQYPVRTIIIHCTATAPDFMAGHTTAERVAEVKRWHTLPEPQGRGWRDIGYHWLIDRDGTIAKGRPEDQIGAHVAGHNAGTIGISLFGGLGSNITDKFAQHFTPEQDIELRNLIAAISKRTMISVIYGHNDYSKAKACPGFKAFNWYRGLE